MLAEAGEYGIPSFAGNDFVPNHLDMLRNVSTRVHCNFSDRMVADGLAADGMGDILLWSVIDTLYNNLGFLNMIDGCCGDIWKGDAKLASAALKLAHHVRTRGRRGGISVELLGLLLELVEFTQGACESPCLCVVRMLDSSDPKLENPERYAESLVLLARDLDAHPWGAFGFVHPKLYLTFLQQLAEDLVK